MACNLRRSLVFGLLLLAACGPPESTCSERDIKSWTPATFEGSTPVYCDSKLVGYQLDIDASDGRPRLWEMVQLDQPVKPALSVSADIDLLTPVARSVRIEQGAFKIAEVYGVSNNVSTTATYKPGDGNVLRAVRVAVPSGMRYRGQIRDVRWD